MQLFSWEGVNCNRARRGSSPFPARPVGQPELSGESAEAYCEYRSHKAFPFSISALAIVTYSMSEHPPDHLSHSLFIPRSVAHASAPAPHRLAITRSHAVSYLHNNIVGVDISIQTIGNMFTYVPWTSAYCMSRWRCNQGG